MAEKIIITKYTGCTADESECPLDTVHALGWVGGDASTLCGLPLVDEAEEFENTKKAVSCQTCIGILERTPIYKKRNGKWY